MKSPQMGTWVAQNGIQGRRNLWRHLRSCHAQIRPALMCLILGHLVWAMLQLVQNLAYELTISSWSNLGREDARKLPLPGLLAHENLQESAQQLLSLQSARKVVVVIGRRPGQKTTRETWDFAHTYVKGTGQYV
mmetsp:Transcript_143280/g.260122  ORF Transcript_143280/g.260122 Transcript_143280/m.260122 type:complete len:134 (+) Transcript_143280:176-577(+)